MSFNLLIVKRFFQKVFCCFDEQRINESAQQQQQNLNEAVQQQQENLAQAMQQQQENLAQAMQQQQENMAQAMQQQQQRLDVAIPQQENLAQAMQQQQENLAQVVEQQQQRLDVTIPQQENLAQAMQQQQERLGITLQQQQDQLQDLENAIADIKTQCNGQQQLIANLEKAFAAEEQEEWEDEVTDEPSQPGISKEESMLIKEVEEELMNERKANAQQEMEMLTRITSPIPDAESIGKHLKNSNFFMAPDVADEVYGMSSERRPTEE